MYLKKYETAVKRKVTIRYAKGQADNLDQVPDPAVFQNEKNSFIKEENNKLLLNKKKGRIDIFINELKSKQHRSHLSIIKLSTIERVKRTVIHIIRKGQWIYTTSSKRYKFDSPDSSCSESDSDSGSSSSNSNSLIEKDFIKMKLSSYFKNKHAGIS